MEELQSNNNQPDFSSLTGIMNHFYNVPFEQFQKELNDWFTKALWEKGIDPQNIKLSGDSNFSSVQDLVSKIYHQAELLKTITESKIDLPDGSK
ncbi:hypothetical protein HDF24_00575 [Mucilaginibacter sp. X4EP1]|uniref:hypothetical protein n=1 Tax=Mucilaginibacter sp. X4EP1 TaxID=2723092 RepID=UPI0021682567|nr:hypothetical protein [Mucilaginibacter sp. X4EP1]MCS3811506.1 hypothetical protein [Mucilaginibacter sp. X4EP1]